MESNWRELGNFVRPAVKQQAEIYSNGGVHNVDPNLVAHPDVLDAVRAEIRSKSEAIDRVWDFAFVYGKTPNPNAVHEFLFFHPDNQMLARRRADRVEPNEELRAFYRTDARGTVVEIDLDITADDFVLLAHPPGASPIPYIYWNFGVTPRSVYDEARRNGTLRDLPFNHNSKFAAEIEPSLRAGIEGLAIASVLSLGS
ncbi:hypothetical protein F4808DRAFT_460305 [Astrocystis sublimbata]|nr:hypothetical protein F4808DRAFT_460305 [Astrocystis sublimbata]